MAYKNIFLIGPFGAGKSSIGQQLAKKLQMEFYDSDAVIEERAGADISWIFDVEGEEGLRKREAQAIEDLTKMQNIVLATGGGSILLPENRNFLAARGIVVYLKASIEQQLSRTARNRSRRPLLQVESDDMREKLIELANQRNPLYEQIADVGFDTDRKTVNSVANDIYQFVTKRTVT